MPVEYAIDARGLVKSYGAARVLGGLDLQVRRGDIFGFLGPNGAGKTTTLHILLGLVPPDEGRAVVAGVDVHRDPHGVRRRCTALLEHHGLYERLDAVENLALVGGVYGLSRAESLSRAREALEGLGIWERRRDRVGTWSKGMKQRLAIARALLPRPEVLFLDEPTNGFDPAAARSLQDDLRRLVREASMTVFLTTHNLRDAERLCGEVAVLRDGRVAAAGAPDELVRRRPGIRVRAERVGPKALAALRRVPGVQAAQFQDGVVGILLASQDDAPAAVAALAAAGVRIHEVHADRPGLEESFLQVLEAP